jgi:hypothetical protein
MRYMLRVVPRALDDVGSLRPFSIAVALPARAERALKICSRGRDGSKKQWTLRPRGQSER